MAETNLFGCSCKRMSNDVPNFKRRIAMVPAGYRVSYLIWIPNIGGRSTLRRKVLAEPDSIHNALRAARQRRGAPGGQSSQMRRIKQLNLQGYLSYSKCWNCYAAEAP